MQRPGFSTRIGNGGGELMPHRYDKYMDDFKKLVAENAAKPPVCDGKEKEIWPSDSDEEELAELWEMLGNKQPQSE